MPLLDIATPQSSFRNNLYPVGFQRLRHVPFLSGTARWNYDKPNRILINPTTLEMSPARLMIRAVATLEPRCSDKENGNAQQLPIDSATNLPIDSATNLPESSSVQDEKEMLRRKRISKANKGKEAWNKGIQHSPETRQKIRERTKIAMHSPKVKMKLLRAIHSQSHETRLKIGAAVRLTWDRRKLKRRMIARCHREWLNLIAEASRKGFCGEKELEWDSYEIIKEQLEKEYREGIEARKKPKSTPGKRTPKTLEQRKKISEAIAAKWADPAYRDRVYCGIAKHRGKSAETRDPEWGLKKKEPKKVKPVKKSDSLYGSRIRNSRPKLKTSGSQMYKEQRARYKDPQAGYKLEMIKSIRAQRAASDPKISEAITRANILIGEAQRAAEALEAAATKSPMAEASLVETRKLIAEAISYIKSIETVNTPSPESMKTTGVNEIEQRGVNGVGGADFGESKKVGGLVDEDVVANGKKQEHIDLSSSLSWGLQMKEEEEDGGKKLASEKEERGGKGRRWVCGRLVEDED